MGLVTLTFDLLTLKLVCESHQRWETFLPNLGAIGLWVLELFAMYATDGQTERRTDGQKQSLLLHMHNNVVGFLTHMNQTHKITHSCHNHSACTPCA